MLDKMEIVKKQLGAMKIEKTEKGYYVRYRKSKNNKIMLDDIFKFEDVIEEDWGAKRIGDYEFTMTEQMDEQARIKTAGSKFFHYCFADSFNVKTCNKFFKRKFFS